MFRNLPDDERFVLTREVLRDIFPLRLDLIDPNKIALADRAARRETPVDVHTETPSRDERLRGFIRSALEEAFALSSKDILGHLEMVIAQKGSVDLLDLPVQDDRGLLFALCAVESVRGEAEQTKLDVVRRETRRDNGVFEANDYRFMQRA